MSTVYFLMGFPKCATSSTWQYFDQLDGVNALVDPVSGSLEVSISSLPAIGHGDNIFLKNASVVYSEKNTSKVVEWAASFERRFFIIQLSDPLSRLYSWYLFHKEIASSGRAPNHFAYKQRQKYLTLSVDDYARERAYLVDYAEYMKKLQPLLAGESVWVVNAQDLKTSYDLYDRCLGRGICTSNPSSINRNRTMLSERPNIQDPSLLLRLGEYKANLQTFFADPPCGWNILSETIF